MKTALVELLCGHNRGVFYASSKIKTHAQVYCGECNAMLEVVGFKVAT